ncbi:uncharacterized protein BX664DRAFT_385835 [Halteromyces radiatus]|uniref:uncharacterized protein n=1 Tax=Halteromyces radiatus TaxID=101107 RepID=UPI00221EBE21|nr:uncharacterized protein BX664DRAFT_385835 [Halteromyces radiatus]KAI8089332.1 hypothetical protein BX664DRAFT_385835 [Halteromyces radiatus]
MLKASTSPNSNKSKKRQLLSLNRRHTATLSQPLPITLPTPSFSDNPTTPNSASPLTETTDPITTPCSKNATPLGDYNCPFCNEDLSNVNTSFGRQKHIDECLLATNDNIKDYEHDVGNDDTQNVTSLFLDYCSFCGKSITHLLGIHKERHFDRCLTSLELEERLAEQQQKQTTFAGRSIPFLQQLDICPVCHDVLSGPSLRTKISHIKRCAKERSLTMERLIRKLQWMQWGHIPIQNTPIPSCSTSQPLPATYSIHATESISDNKKKNKLATTRSNDIKCSKRSTSLLWNETDHQEGDDGDFKNDVLIYKVASWHQTKIKKPPLSEDESMAIALSLSLQDQQQPTLTARRNKRKKVDHDSSNIISIQESKQLAFLNLERMLAKHTMKKTLPTIQFPLVTSQVRPYIPPRSSDKITTTSSSSSTKSLWNMASCVD